MEAKIKLKSEDSKVKVKAKSLPGAMTKLAKLRQQMDKETLYAQGAE